MNASHSRPALCSQPRPLAAVLATGCCLCLALSGCASDSVLSASLPTPTVEINLTINRPQPTIPPTLTPLPTPTPVPSPTPEPTVSPFAARVNGQDIPVEAYQRELRRYLLAEPGGPAPDSPEWLELAAQLKDTVLNALIEQALIQQEAAAAGLAVTSQQIDAEVAALISIRGGREQFDAWLAASQQTEPDVREMVQRELTANAMRDRIVSQLPRTAEYVRAYHIVVDSEIEAQAIQASLDNGAQFTALAESKSIDDSTRPDGGDLGWFTRGAGAVLWTEVEDAAFALQPGQVSPIIQSPVGFHLIKVVDRQTRALTAEDTSIFQQVALQRWLEKLKENARIEKFL